MQEKLAVFLSSTLSPDPVMGATAEEIASFRSRLKERINSLEHYTTWLFEDQRHSRPEPVDDDYLSSVEDHDLVVVVLGASIPIGVQNEIEQAVRANKPLLMFLHKGHKRMLAESVSEIIARAVEESGRYNWHLYGKDPVRANPPRWEPWGEFADLAKTLENSLNDLLVHFAKRYVNAVIRGSLFPPGHFLDSMPSWSDELKRTARSLIVTGQGRRGTELLKDQFFVQSVSPLGQAEALVLIGWHFVRTCAYQRALGYFDEARDLFLSAAAEPTLKSDLRSRAKTGAAKSLGAMGLAAFYRGDAERAERLIQKENQELAALGPTASSAFEQGIGKVGVERRSAKSNRLHLEQPFRFWLGEDYDRQLAGLADMSVDVEQAVGIADGLLYGLSVSECAPKKAIQVFSEALSQIRRHTGWTTAGDALFELADWWIVPAWNRAFWFALASLFSFQSSDTDYAWGEAMSLHSVGRAIHRAIKSEPYALGLLPGAENSKAAHQISALHSEAARIYLEVFPNPSGHANALRSLASLQFDSRVNRGEQDMAIPLGLVHSARQHHENIEAERQAIIDIILLLRIEEWVRNKSGPKKDSGEGFRDDVVKTYDKARALGCLRLQAEIAHEFSAYLDRARRGPKSIFSKVLEEPPHASAIL